MMGGLYLYIKPYLLSFIPIFVAINILGILPIFLSLTAEMSEVEKKKNIVESVITATSIAIIFMLVGKLIFLIMGITVADFKIGGGILLLILSVNLLLPGVSSAREKQYQDAGIFPIGTPLITGPAVLTTTLVLTDAFGMFATFISLVLNMLISWIALVNSDRISRTIGLNGMRAFSKVGDIFLTAIAVMMIRSGIQEAYKIFFK
ncbi:MAG: MarC family protein [bacterium]|nr:MarC family protein [bacterium]